MTVPRHQLTDQYDISRIVIGGWQLSAGHNNRTATTSDLMNMLDRLVDHGFTTFDCADIYTGVESFLGEYRASRKLTDGIQVHTKFVPDRDDLAHVDRRYVERIIDRSLRRLQCDALDLVQFAWWDYNIDGWQDAARVLAELQREGKIRHLGITNFNTRYTQDLLNVGIPLVANQVQYSVLDRRPERGTVALCRKHGVGLLCYGTVAGGFLSNRYLRSAPPPEPLENRSLTKYRLIIEEYGGWDAYQALLETLGAIAGRYNTTVANVAIRYVLQRPAVAGAIVGARNDDHVEALSKIWSFELSTDDIRAIDAHRPDGSGPPGDVFDVERDPAGPHGRIMKYNLNRGDERQ